ncbi:BNR repeat-containing protein [Streptomyces tricolor]|nr:BNR repeat-containing protein [Streptomyces tricolor]
MRTTLDGLALTSQFTYPQFVATPEWPAPAQLPRRRLRRRPVRPGRVRRCTLDRAREWTGATGTYTSAHGSSTARNMYLHGLDYDTRGRLHALFTWREQNAAVMCSRGGITNHDTGYVFSDDRGRTWRNDAGTVVGTTGGPDKVCVGDSGLVVDPLSPDHSLMNQESQFTDSAGRPQAIISYVPGRFGRCTTGYVADRTAHGRAFHLRKNASGGWQKTEIPVPLGSSQRTKLVLDRYDNAYAVLPFGRIAAASAGLRVHRLDAVVRRRRTERVRRGRRRRDPDQGGPRPVVPVPGEVHRDDALGAARGRLRPAGVTVM